MSSSKLISVIKYDDQETLVRLSGKMGTPRMARWFWEDSLRQTPETILTSFVLLFANPANLVLDLAGDGVLVFADIRRGLRATLHAAVWGPKAARKPALHRTAIAVAMTALNLYELDAFTAEDNRACLMALQAVGFRRKYVLPSNMCYNGTRVDAFWYQITREDILNGQLL